MIGMYEILMNNIIFRNELDTMFNEYANVLSTDLIASEEPMYYDKWGIETRNYKAYGDLNWPGSMMCAALGISEIELAKLKDQRERKI